MNTGTHHEHAFPYRGSYRGKAESIISQVVSELVLGANEEVEAFVGAFVEKRKAFTDYLRVGEDNLRRFSPMDIAAYKEMFKEVLRCTHNHFIFLDVFINLQHSGRRVDKILHTIMTRG